MSEHWTVYCEAHEEYGPDLMRSAGRGFRLSKYWPRFHADPGQFTIDPAEAWAEFMEKHGYCPLKLVHE